MKKVFILFYFTFSAVALWAQTPLNMGGSLSVVRGCNFIIYDNGGSGSGYGNNRTDRLTIYSSDNALPCVTISIDVSAFNVHPSDTLFIYDAATHFEDGEAKVKKDGKWGTIDKENNVVWIK